MYSTHEIIFQSNTQKVENLRCVPRVKMLLTLDRAGAKFLLLFCGCTPKFLLVYHGLCSEFFKHNMLAEPVLGVEMDQLQGSNTVKR